MARKFYTPIDLSLNEIQSVKIEGVSSDPATATAGRIIYRTDLKTLKLGNGTSWVPLGNVTVAAGAPGTTPSATGSMYFDSTNFALYVANGTSSSADWKPALPGASSATALSNPASAGASATGTAGTSISYARADHTHAHGGSDHNNIRLSDLSTTLSTNVDFSGSGFTIRVTTPSNSLDAVNKSYVDSVATGVNAHDAVGYATTANLTATYSNGSSGVGATLTNSGAQAVLAIDGYTFQASDVTNSTRVLVKNQTNAKTNGIYVVTSIGSVSTNWVLTRATDNDQPAELSAGDFCYILNGTINGKYTYIQTNTVTSIDATTGSDINWTILSNGNISGVVTPVQGGTGTSTAPTTGQFLIGRSDSTYALNTLTQGTGVTITNATTGTVTIGLTATGTAGTYGTATQVAQITTNAQGQVTAASSVNITGLAASAITNTALTQATTFAGDVSGTSGAITLANSGITAATYGSASAVPAITFDAKGRATIATNTTISIAGSQITSGTVAVAQGGTGAGTFTANGVILGNTTSALQVTAAGSAFNVLRVPAAGGAPAFGAISLTSSSAITGTLPAGNGGTGQSTYAIGDLLYADTTSSLAKLADVATGNALISGGVGTAPAWGKIGLTTHVSGTLPVANGGTGGTDAATARTNLGATGKATGTISFFSTSATATITHSLAATAVVVQLYDTSWNKVETDITLTNSNTATVTIASAQALTLNYVVIG